MTGRPVVMASWLGTGVFAVTAVATLVGAPKYPAVVVALVLFAGSLPLAIYALAQGALSDRPARPRR